MVENHPGREEKRTSCRSCGAEIEYTVAVQAAVLHEGDGIRCPSCGRLVETEGDDPRLREFGPGVGQSGA